MNISILPGPGYRLSDPGPKIRRLRNDDIPFIHEHFMRLDSRSRVHQGRRNTRFCRFDLGGGTTSSRRMVCCARTLIFVVAFVLAGFDVSNDMNAQAYIWNPKPEPSKLGSTGFSVMIPFSERDSRDKADKEEDKNKLREEADSPIKIRSTPASKSLKGIRTPLLMLLVKVQEHFGKPLDIVSGCRSKRHNRRVGGAGRSQHLHCNAVDFQIPGVSKSKLSVFIKSLKGRGGVGTYCRSSYVHLDAGPRRDWHWRCRKQKTVSRAAVKTAKSSKSAPKKPVAPPAFRINDLINQ